MTIEEESKRKKIKKNGEDTVNLEENQNSFFVYLIGETSTSFDITNDAITYFNKNKEEELKTITLIILHTLVTYDPASELEIELKRVFGDIKSYLIPATENDVMRYVIRMYDTPSTVIKILGGSWNNAAAIAAEVTKSQIYVFRTRFDPSNFYKMIYGGKI